MQIKTISEFGCCDYCKYERLLEFHYINENKKTCNDCLSEIYKRKGTLKKVQKVKK